MMIALQENWSVLINIKLLYRKLNVFSSQWSFLIKSNDYLCFLSLQRWYGHGCGRRAVSTAVSGRHCRWSHGRKVRAACIADSAPSLYDKSPTLPSWCPPTRRSSTSSPNTGNRALVSERRTFVLWSSDSLDPGLFTVMTEWCFDTWCDWIDDVTSWGSWKPAVTSDLNGFESHRNGGIGCSTLGIKLRCHPWREKKNYKHLESINPFLRSDDGIDYKC